ncbi:CG15674, partial [Drosophila busckii]
IALLSCGVLLSTCGLCLAYQERPDFCIDTEPLLLDDISKQVFVLSEKQLRCNVTATTLTAKEKESLIDTLCRDHGSTLGQHSHHHYFKLHNGELNGRGTQQDICAQSARSMLAWVPYKTMLLQYGHELNPKERLSYMAKATSVEREKTELCHFRHTDLVNGVQDNLFTCVVMIFEDNFYGVEDNINVLVELQPLMYQLRNITYSPWRNVTNSYKMRLGSSVLRNPSGQRKPIYGSINYAFVEKIRLNISSVYGQSSLKRLPLLLEHRGSVLELDAAGVGGMDVQEQAYFGRTMDAKTEVQLQVIGQWMDQHREFTADIYEYYGHGLLLYKQAIAGGRVTFVRIDSTEPAFEAPESQNLAKASLFVDPAAMPAKLSVNSSVSEWHEEQQEDENNSSFYPWFVLSCLLIGIVVLVLVYGVVRVNNKKNQQRQKYELPNANKPPPT